MQTAVDRNLVSKDRQPMNVAAPLDPLLKPLSAIRSTSTEVQDSIAMLARQQEWFVDNYEKPAPWGAWFERHPLTTLNR